MTTSTIRYSAAVALVVGVFVAVWSMLAGGLTAWSDELDHIAEAKGLLLTGQPFAAVFDTCAEVLGPGGGRATEISRLTEKSFRLFGESMTSARLVPFIFTIGSWLLYLAYTGWRGYSSRKQVLIATLLFFGQSMVLEKALYVRVYAPLLFFIILSLIGIWEGFNYWREGRRPMSLAWLAVAVLSLAITARWHLVQYGILVVAVVFLWLLARNLAPGYLIRSGWSRLVSLPAVQRYAAIALLALGLLAIMAAAPQALNELGARLFGFQKVHVTSWDNLFGLIRFLLVTNVLLFLWWRRSEAPGGGRDFNSWVLDVGIVSALLIALLMNHNFVFWSRYFYPSVGLIALGVSGTLALSPRVQYIFAVLGTYVVINGLVSGFNLTLDRSNIKGAIDWLNNNSTDRDTILAYNAQLYLYNGKELCGRTVTITNSATKNLGDFSYLQGPGTYQYISIEDLATTLDSKPSGNVYFLYTDAHEFRRKLFSWTTGRSRSQRNDLYGLLFNRPALKQKDMLRLLRDGDLGEDVISGLRGSGLKRIDRGSLIQALETSGLP